MLWVALSWVGLGLGVDNSFLGHVKGLFAIFLTAWAVQRPFNPQIDKLQDSQTKNTNSSTTLYGSVLLYLALFDYVWLI